jgi:hypothetical protein
MSVPVAIVGDLRGAFHAIASADGLWPNFGHFMADGLRPWRDIELCMRDFFLFVRPMPDTPVLVLPPVKNIQKNLRGSYER